MGCVFCDRLLTGGHVAENATAVAFADAFPLTPGHTLIIPRRHQGDFLLLTPEEQFAIRQLVSLVRAYLEREFRPDGYNLGINVGLAAGQTIEHAHLHVIPRYAGDAADPRGGVRWIIPTKAKYWED